MAVLEVLIFPHKSLRRKAVPVAEVTDEVRLWLEDMAETMYHAPGVGLAGPQVGISHRVLVVDISEMAQTGDQNPGLLKVINPRIISVSGTRQFEEGCLSLPGLSVEIERPEMLTVAYTDTQGQEQQMQTTGLLSTVLQHEIDHLDGVLILDRLSTLKRSRYTSWLKKEIKKGEIPRGEEDSRFQA